MPTTRRKPVTTRKATRAEMRKGNGRERSEAAAKRRNRRTNRTTTNPKEATMARKPRTASTKTKPKAAASATAPAASNGRQAFSLTKKDATAIAKRLREGTTMKEIRTEYGHSDGSKVRAALREHGFGSKGQDNPDGLTPTEWRAKYGGNGNGAETAKPKRTRARAAATAEPEPEPEADEAEDEAAEETTAERRARKRRERRAAAKAPAKPARKRSRKPKATAADPS